MKFTCVHRLDELSKNLADKLSSQLIANGYECDESNPEVVFVIGGDGTFLYAVHKYLDKLDDISFLGIHTGTLGFFTDYTDEEYEEFINDFLNKEPDIIEYQLLKVETGNKVYYALNEMRVENVKRTQKIKVYVNDEEFEEFAGTGLCICTQLGSTAFNRSLKGAVIQEGLPLIQMSEISGIHNRYYQSLGTSIVMKEDAHIRFVSDSFESALLCIDFNTYSLDHEQEVNIKLSGKKVRMLRYKKVGYFKRLKSLF